MLLKGNIISGEWDETSNLFSLQTVKHFSVESSIKENQVKSLYHYLKNHENDADGQVITLYDQMPVHLSQKEIADFISDLEKILSMY